MIIDKFLTLWLLCVYLVFCKEGTKNDENRPYEFGFSIDGQQHRHERRDANGIIQGEFGFITADGVYHVTVYATDENGRFKILSMRNIKISEPLDGSQVGTYTTKPLHIGQTFSSSTPQPKQPPSINQTQVLSTKPACAGCGYVTESPTPSKPSQNDQNQGFISSTPISKPNLVQNVQNVQVGNFGGVTKSPISSKPSQIDQNQGVISSTSISPPNLVQNVQNVQVGTFGGATKLPGGVISKVDQSTKQPFVFTTQPTIKPACAGCGYVTKASSTTPSTQNVYGGGLIPGGQSLSPGGENLRPGGENLRPSGENLRPNGENLRPSGENLRPSGENLRPIGGDLGSTGENLRPGGQGFTVQGGIQTGLNQQGISGLINKNQPQQNVGGLVSTQTGGGIIQGQNQESHLPNNLGLQPPKTPINQNLPQIENYPSTGINQQNQIYQTPSGIGLQPNIQNPQETLSNQNENLPQDNKQISGFEDNNKNLNQGIPTESNSIQITPSQNPPKEILSHGTVNQNIQPPSQIPTQNQGYQPQTNTDQTSPSVQDQSKPHSIVDDIKIENNAILVPNNPPIPIQDKYPGMKDGLPDGITSGDISDLLYKFNYTIGFHGHYEMGWRNGTKVGGYFVNGRDGISRIVTYVADEFGYRPKVRLINLGYDSILTPKEDTEKSFGLQSFEFVWYPLK